MSIRKFSQILFLLLCTGLAALPAVAAGPSPTYGKNGVVATDSAIASDVGIEILRKGGNAADAAVATAFALAVTFPTAGNIGGGGFMIWHGVDGETAAFDFREKAPLAATVDMYQNADGTVRNNSNHEGILAVGVPGSVAGLELAHQRFGKLSWHDVVEPAIQLARTGIPLSWKLHEGFIEQMERFKQYPASLKKFTRSDGSPYQPGDLWVQPDLAKSLERIQEQGKKGFYEGETARLLADFMAKNGGLITLEDLAEYTAVEREPIQGEYRGYQVVSMPPPTSGGVILVQMLNILEGFDLARAGHNSALSLHLLAETMRRAYADRAQYLGDPDFNEDMPLLRMLSKSYAAKMREGIDPAKASASDPALYAQQYEGNHTTHFSVADSQGNMVALTTTLEEGYGSRIVADGTGFLLNNEMGDFNARPGVTDAEGSIGSKPNQIRPGQRMLSSMTPTVVAKDGLPLFATGAQGGKTIINTVLQSILNVIDHEMNISESVNAGRISNQWLPDETKMERGRFSPDTIRLFEQRGHKINWQDEQGAANAVFRDPDTGILSGGFDARSADGKAAAF